MKQKAHWKVCTWRIIQVSKWLGTHIYKPFKPFGRRTTLLRELTKQGYSPLTTWDDPPSKRVRLSMMHILSQNVPPRCPAG